MRKLALLLGSSVLFLLVLCCRAYDQFERHINEEFVQALPATLQEPSRNAWHLLRDHSFLRIDLPRIWEHEHLGIFEQFASNLEILLKRLPEHLESFFPRQGRYSYSIKQLLPGEQPEVDHDTAAFDALPVQLRGLLCLFQVKLDASQRGELVLVHGMFSFKVVEGDPSTWWAVRKARARFEALHLRFCWIQASINQYPITAIMLFAGNKYWERIYDSRILVSAFLMADSAKTLADLDQLPTAQFNLVEQDLVLAIKSLAADLKVFRRALFKITEAAPQSSNFVFLGSPDVGGQALRHLHSLATFILLNPLHADCLVAPSIVPNVDSAGLKGDRQVRFATLASRLLLLFYGEASKVQATAFDHPLRFMWTRQESSLCFTQIPVNSVDMTGLELAYKTVSEAHPGIMSGIVKGLGTDDPSQVKESLAPLAEPLNAFRLLIIDALLYAALRLSLYDLSKELEPEARVLLTKVHQIAVGSLRQLDEMIELVTKIEGDEYVCNRWLLILLPSSECDWIEFLAVMRTLVPRFEAKLRMPEADIYKWRESPLSAYLFHISTSE